MNKANEYLINNFYIITKEHTDEKENNVNIFNQHKDGYEGIYYELMTNLITILNNFKPIQSGGFVKNNIYNIKNNKSLNQKYLYYYNKYFI